MKRIYLVKLGGGLIAPKEWETEIADWEVIRSLIREISDSGKKVLIVSGSGNFGHFAVKKYGIQTPGGVEKVRRSAKKIGEIVALEMRKAGFDAELVETHKYFRNKNDLNLDKTLVFYGDVADTKDGGWTIYSGEKIIELLVPIIKSGNWEIEKIIQVSKEIGVWDAKGKLIPKISLVNWEYIKKDVMGSKGIDMTGGMLHKVEESMEIATKYGVKTQIISGKVRGRLLESLKNDEVVGTLVV